MHDNSRVSVHRKIKELISVIRHKDDIIRKIQHAKLDLRERQSKDTIKQFAKTIGQLYGTRKKLEAMRVACAACEVKITVLENSLDESPGKLEKGSEETNNFHLQLERFKSVRNDLKGSHNNKMGKVEDLCAASDCLWSSCVGIMTDGIIECERNFEAILDVEPLRALYDSHFQAMIAQSEEQLIAEKMGEECLEQSQVSLNSNFREMIAEIEEQSIAEKMEEECPEQSRLSLDSNFRAMIAEIEEEPEIEILQIDSVLSDESNCDLNDSDGQNSQEALEESLALVALLLLSLATLMFI